MKRLALGVAAVVAVCVVVIAIPVVRISRAVPGTNPGSVEQVHGLIDRYQEEGADPTDGNAFELLFDAVACVEGIQEGVGLRVRADIEADEELSSLFYTDTGSVALWHAFEDLFKFEPGDPEYVRRDSISEIYRGHARRGVDQYVRGEASDLLDQVARVRYARRTQTEGLLLATMLPEMGAVGMLGEVNMALISEACEEGDSEECARRFEHNLAAARALALQPTFIERLVASRLLTRTLEMAGWLAVDGCLDANALRGMLDAVDQQLPIAPARLSIEGQELWVLDAVERLHSDGDYGYYLPIAGAQFGDYGGGATLAGSPSVANVSGLFSPRKAETIEVVEAYFKELARYAEAVPSQRNKSRMVSVTDAFESHSDLLEILLPAPGRFIASLDAEGSKVSGCRAVLAIELYSREHGKLPDTLGDLVPEYLSGVPLDPFAPDGQLGYRVFDKPDADGQRYALYSTGYDGVDDGGRVYKERPEFAFAPRALELGGVDYVFNQPAATDAGD